MPSGLLKVSVSEDFLDFFWGGKPQERNHSLDSLSWKFFSPAQSLNKPAPTGTATHIHTMTHHYTLWRYRNSLEGHLGLSGSFPTTPLTCQRRRYFSSISARSPWLDAPPPNIPHKRHTLQVLSYTCHTFLVPTTFHGCPPPPSHLTKVTHALYPVVSHLLPPVSLQCGTHLLLSLPLTTSLPLPNSQAPLLPCPDW